jgi:hypothetical protein
VRTDDASPADAPSRWYRYCESFGVVIGGIGVTLWGLAAKPGNSATLLGSTVAIAGLGASLLVTGLAGHWVSRRNKGAGRVMLVASARERTSSRRS